MGEKTDDLNSINARTVRDRAATRLCSRAGLASSTRSVLRSPGVGGRARSAGRVRRRAVQGRSGQTRGRIGRGRGGTSRSAARGRGWALCWPGPAGAGLLVAVRGAERQGGRERERGAEEREKGWGERSREWRRLRWLVCDERIEEKESAVRKKRNGAHLSYTR
jgi:hypothetical protein